MFAVAFALFIASALASSHSEAPGTAKGPRSDLTDVYLFRSPQDSSRGAEQDKYVTAVININPLQQSQAGPNYNPVDTRFVYAGHFDTDGDNVEDISFQFIFETELNGDPVRGITVATPQGIRQSIPLVSAGVLDATHGSLNAQEFYRVRVTKGRVEPGQKVDEGSFWKNANEDGATKFSKAFDFAGRKTMGLNLAGNTEGATAAYEKYAATRFYKNVMFEGCEHPARVFVGPRRESFSIPLGKVFNLIGVPGDNSLDRFSTTSMVFEVHQDCLIGDNDPNAIGFYASVRRIEHTTLGEDAHVLGEQITRLGNPLINELLIEVARKNEWNTQHPSDDEQFISYYKTPFIANIISTVLGVTSDFAAPVQLDERTDVVAALLTGLSFRCADDVELCNDDNLFVLNSGSKGFADLLRFSLSTPQQTRASQLPGAITELDIFGFPNGRRLGDDVVDIYLRVLFGLVCEDVPLPFGNTLSESLGVCTADQSLLDLTTIAGLGDGAVISACDFSNHFPYLNTPVPGDIMMDVTGITPQFTGESTCVDM